MITTVTTTQTTLLPTNRRRVKVYFQNAGNQTIYFKKVNPGTVGAVVSPTNYDFKLDKATSESPEPMIVETISGFIAITGSATSDCAIMQTERLQ